VNLPWCLFLPQLCSNLSDDVNSGTTTDADSRLRYMHGSCTMMCMRTTLILKDELIDRAAELTGIREKTALVHLGLESLIAQENRKRLLALGGSQNRLRPIPRRRSPAAR